MNYRFLLLIALLGAGVCLSACDRKAGSTGNATTAKSTSGPAAIVGDGSVSKELFEFYARNRTNKASSELKPEQRQQLLDQLIGLQVAAQQAQKDGLDRDADIAARLELTRLNVLAESQVAKKLGGKQPTEQELRAEYETQVAALPQLEYHARHILVATEPFAQSLIDKIQKGDDFAAIARKESMDAKENGGDLGWVNPTRMVPEFSKALTSLKKGEMTPAPVKSEFGYHIIRLEDTRPVSPPEYDAVKDRLPGLVQQRKAQAYVDELKKTTKIEKKI